MSCPIFYDQATYRFTLYTKNRKRIQAATLYIHWYPHKKTLYLQSFGQIHKVWIAIVLWNLPHSQKIFNETLVCWCKHTHKVLQSAICSCFVSLFCKWFPVFEIFIHLSPHRLAHNDNSTEHKSLKLRVVNYKTRAHAEFSTITNQLQVFCFSSSLVFCICSIIYWNIHQIQPLI